MKKIILLYLILIFLAKTGLSQKTDISTLKAVASVEKGDYDSALSDLDGMPVEKNAELAKLKGTCYLNLKQPEVALKYFLLADSLSTGSSTYEIAVCYAEIGKNEKALAWLGKHLEGKVKHSEYTVKTDSAFALLENTPEWNSFWKKNWYTESETEINAISSLINNGKAGEALAELDKNNAKISPKHIVNALYSKAYSLQKLWDPALNYINKAIDQNNRTDVYFAQRSAIYAQLRKYQQATEDITKAIQLSSYKPEYYIKRAEYSRLSGNLKQAESDMDIYKVLAPNSPETFEQLGLLESAKGNNFNALNYYNQLIAADPGKPEYFILRGNTAFKVKQYEQADEDFGMALDLDPTKTEAWLNKGNLKLIMGDKNSACYYLEMAKMNGSAEAAKLMYDNCK